MLLVSLIRWLKGTVTFIITGAFPERFISFCRKGGIPLWKVKRDKRSVRADCYAADYKRLRHAARDSSVRLRIAQKKGLFVHLHRHRRRIGIPLGIAAAVLLTVFCSARVWRIEVGGCSEEVADSVRYELSRNGVTVGCAKSRLDVSEIQSRIMLSDDRVAWIAINLVGSTAFVEVSERQPPPERIDPDGRVANIVAACDGQIKYLEVYSGQAMVRVGDTVSRGDIIVSGIMEDQYGKKQFKYARAKVVARVSEQIKAEVPLEQLLWRQSGERRGRWFIDLGSRQLPILGFGPKPGPHSVSEQREKFLFFDLIKRVYTPQQLTVVTLTERQAKENAMRMLDGHDAPSEDEKLISRTRSAELVNGVYTVTERRVIEKDIAVTSEVTWDAQGGDMKAL